MLVDLLNQTKTADKESKKAKYFFLYEKILRVCKHDRKYVIMTVFMTACAYISCTFAFYFNSFQFFFLVLCICLLFCVCFLFPVTKANKDP